MKVLRFVDLLPLLFVSVVLCTFTGCAMPKPGGNTGTQPTGPGTPTGPSTDPSNLTGNWQLTLAASNKAQMLTGMAGSITQAGSTTSQGQFTSSVLRVDGLCFDSTASVPLQGTNASGALMLTSYPVNGQSVLLSGTLESSNKALDGTYAAYGGCADGAGGNFTAVRYDALSGTYSGVLQAISPVTVTLTLTQASVTTGSGTFLLSGNLALHGDDCTLSAPVTESVLNYAQGNTFQIKTNDNGASAFVTGTFDPTATTLTNVKLFGLSGTCAGVRGTGALSK